MTARLGELTRTLGSADRARLEQYTESVREIETRIYNTLPHHMPALLRRHPPRCPVAFVAGTRSAEMRQAGLAGSRALAGERFVSFEGTHLYPMERPDDTARLVLQLLDGMGVKP